MRVFKTSTQALTRYFFQFFVIVITYIEGLSTELHVTVNLFTVPVENLISLKSVGHTQEVITTHISCFKKYTLSTSSQTSCDNWTPQSFPYSNLLAVCFSQCNRNMNIDQRYFGKLGVWVRHLRKSIHFEKVLKTYAPSAFSKKHPPANLSPSDGFKVCPSTALTLGCPTLKKNKKRKAS